MVSRSLSQEGMELYQKSDFSAAAEKFRASVQEDSERWQDWRMLGFALHAGGQHDEAAQSFRKALGIKFDDPDNHYGHGIASLAMGDLQHAIKAFEEVLKRQPHHGHARSALVESLIKRADQLHIEKNLFGVEQYLERAHKLDITSVPAFVKLVDYYSETGQHLKLVKLAEDANPAIAAHPEGRAAIVKIQNDPEFQHARQVMQLRNGPVSPNAKDTPAPQQGLALVNHVSGPAPQHPPIAPPGQDLPPAATNFQGKVGTFDMGMGPKQVTDPGVVPQAPTDAQTQFKNCPSCHRQVTAWAAVCPYCLSTINANHTYSQFKGRDKDMKLTKEEIAYKVLCWLWIAFGLMNVAVNVIGQPQMMSYVSAGIAGLGVLLAIGCLLENDTAQLVGFWVAVLSCLGPALGVAFGIMAILSGMASGWILGVLFTSAISLAFYGYLAKFLHKFGAI